jgi:TolB-like protein
VLAACAVVLLIAFVAILIFRAPSASAPGPSANQSKIVIAVLPFDNQSTDAANDHLAAALADEIQFSLTKNNSVSVIAGGSTFRFRDKKQDLKTIAQALNTTHIVDGALRRTSLGVRVGVNLIDAGTETIIWSTVEEHVDDEIYAIRDSVALGIISALGASAPGDCGGAAPARDPDPEAYETYLQARALYRDGSKENLERAIGFLESATAIDPHFADAWATLAMAELNRILYDYAHPRASVPAVRRAAARALELDPCSVDARLAIVIADWRERTKSVQSSVADFANVLKMAPNNPAVLSRMGMLYHEVGRLKDSVRMHERAYRLDPLSASTATYYIWSLYIAGAAEEANALASEVQKQWAEGPNMYAVLLFPSFLAAGDYDAARNWAHNFATFQNQWLFPGLPPLSLLVDFVDAVESRDDTAYQAIRTELLASADQGVLLHHYVFEILAAAGFHADAFELAQERIGRDDFWFRGTLFRPSLKQFRHDPRVMELFEQNGLLEYWQTSGEWPDFCEEPDLPYDCRSEAALLARNANAP